MAKKYKKELELKSKSKDFQALVPCYLTDKMNLEDFKKGILDKYFFGAKLYPINATTNSLNGVRNIESIYPALEILEKYNAPLLIHGEKVDENISIFDREKYFIDDELVNIMKRFENLKIILEHVSSAYGADFVAESNENLAATVTVHHLMLTKKDVFNGMINPFNYCMPVVKEEKDLISLRKYVCSGNSKFFLGTDSAPHDIQDKNDKKNFKPGIYTAPIALEMYVSIFEEENSLNNLEKFTSINGPNFYNLPQNSNILLIKKEEWTNSEFTVHKSIKIKNFMGGKKISWKIV